MSKQELLAEIQKLPVDEQRQLLQAISYNIAQGSNSTPEPMSETQLEHLLLEKGIILGIPASPDQEQSEDDFEPLLVDGKPVSETIIEERR
ncbi:MAG: hypothetical protein ACREDR_13495 [Blastocatellia bacterium]